MYIIGWWKRDTQVNPGGFEPIPIEQVQEHFQEQRTEGQYFSFVKQFILINKGF